MCVCVCGGGLRKTPQRRADLVGGASNVQNTKFCVFFHTVFLSFDRRHCAGSMLDLGVTLLVITGRTRLSNSVGEGDGAAISATDDDRNMWPSYVLQTILNANIYLHVFYTRFHRKTFTFARLI